MNKMTVTQNQEAVQYNKQSYIINGKQTFINSASVHYFRMPKEEWREVLVKAKLAGMNCIDTYFAWNVHEPEEGVWTFDGDFDCGEFLDLCAELELWVIARPGPFICAEWDFGGFPYWLNTKKGMKFRTVDETYLKYVDRYMDKIIPIIHDREIGKGGTVILVQIENEYGYLADDETARDYMHYLRDGMIKRGIEVPLITCVGSAENSIEGANFWSNAEHHYKQLVDKQPDVPKIVTEFWTGWFEHWGAGSATHKTAALYEKRTLEAIRAGFSGISHYMFFGGTNFGGYGGRTVGASDIFMVTSYDYNAPLNEYGRVTDKYNTAKRMSYFVIAIEEFLLNSNDGVCDSAVLKEGISARVKQRGSERIWLLESSNDERETINITLDPDRTIPVIVNPGAIVPVIDRLEIEYGVKLTCNTFLIGNENINGIQTLIVYADNGQRSHIELETEKTIWIEHDGVRRQQLLEDGKRLTLDLCHFQEAQLINMMIGEKPYRIVAIDRTAADHAWRIVKNNEVRWAIGYADVNLLQDGSLKAALNQSGALPIHLGIWDDMSNNVSVAPYVHLQAPVLNGWKKTTYKLSQAYGKWTEKPLAFSDFGQPFGHLLYECSFKSGNKSVTQLVIPKLEDTARVYINGQEQALISKVGAAAVNLKLMPNSMHTLQILVQNMGRLNFSPFLGEVKGLDGAVYLDSRSYDLRGEWQSEETVVNLGAVLSLPQDSIIHRTFELSGHNRALLVGAISGKLKINGHEIDIAGYQNWFAHHTLDISEYILDGFNEIEMSYVKSPLERLELITYSSEKELGGWQIANVEALEREEADGNSGLAGKPVWYTTKFEKPQLPDDVNAKMMLRLTGMSKGTIWLNGIDLGRYWQVGPQEDYKIPMAWLQECNELVLFDESGANPANVRLLFDLHSHHRWVQIG